MPRPVRRGSNAQWDSVIYGDANETSRHGHPTQRRRNGGESRNKQLRREFDRRARDSWDADDSDDSEEWTNAD